MITISFTDAEEIMGFLLDQPWHKNCEIIPEWMPQHPQSYTKPILVVKYLPYDSYLRYSQGPKQGFFWDVYPDDMQSVALAVMALNRAPAPIDTRPIMITFPLKNFTKNEVNTE